MVLYCSEVCFAEKSNMNNLDAFWERSIVRFSFLRLLNAVKMALAGKPIGYGWKQYRISHCGY